MKKNCPNPECLSKLYCKDGFYHRRADGRSIQRFKCSVCGKKFSMATGTKTYRMRVRRPHTTIMHMLCSGVSRNRSAKLLRVSRGTIGRKLIYLAQVCHDKNLRLIAEKPKTSAVQFDELETFEHTKCKPLAVALAVEEKTRLILGVEVSEMPAKGHLTQISREKYGMRKDLRRTGMVALFEKIKQYLAEDLHLLSDQCPFYNGVVQQVFASDQRFQVSYDQVKGGRSSIGGQGELKKLLYDPLFWLNHTCAMLRANINRLFRKTWCTTKKVVNLGHHLRLYAYYHNRYLLQLPQ